MNDKRINEPVEPFDYTKWRQGWEDTRSVEELSREATALQRKDKKD